MVLDVSQIGVSVVLSVIVVIVVILIVSKRLFIPILDAYLDEKMKDTQNMMKAAASALGDTGREAKDAKKMEKMMVGDIMDKYPELEIALEYFSPETAEMIRKHPQRALTILARYKPILEEVLGMKAEEKTPFQY